jgi:hypothetical protein
MTCFSLQGCKVKHAMLLSKVSYGMFYKSPMACFINKHAILLSKVSYGMFYK